jgi:hypoxanthine phosphoribosyltransferase
MSSHQDIRVMISAEQIAQRVQELGDLITTDYQGTELTVVCILKGSFVFCADLVRAIALPVRVDFLGLSSYEGNSESTGVVRITSDLAKPIEGRQVLVVEDIVDTGLTVDFLVENLKTRKPAGLSVCTLLEKPSQTIRKVAITYRGFEIPDAYVVGYGLDYNEKYRNLPFIGALAL